MGTTQNLRGVICISLLAGSFLTTLCQAAAPSAPDPKAALAELQGKYGAIPDTQGTGPFPALKEETASLADHVIYRPAQLDRLGGAKLGLYLFGNGGCSNDGASSRLHLLEVASHGYLAIAPGRIRSGPGATAPLLPPPPFTLHPNPGGALASIPERPTSSKDLISALDWALAQNADPASPYYKRIDTTAVAVSGYSCGGLQALLVASDPRVKTVVVMNSGIYNPGTSPPIDGMEGLSKSLLETIHTPVLYILGGKTDVAYPNGMDDFARISREPVFVGNILKATHAGTYWEPYGGKAAAAVVAWLNWQLRHDGHAGKTFLGKTCGLCTDPAWQVQKKQFD